MHSSNLQILIKTSMYFFSTFRALRYPKTEIIHDLTRKLWSFVKYEILGTAFHIPFYLLVSILMLLRYCYLFFVFLINTSVIFLLLASIVQKTSPRISRLSSSNREIIFYMVFISSFCLHDFKKLTTFFVCI
ncbi:MAG: hypothetical protein OXF28_04725 [Thaumarchaeota archaeon]|nr:hypothetical protein [Nitrososphaerota archaeon]